MTFGEPFEEAMQQAVLPTPADVFLARTCIVRCLQRAGIAVKRSDFVDEWMAAQEQYRPQQRTIYRAQPSDVPGRLQDPDPFDPDVMVFRGRLAVDQAIAELVGEGVLTRGHGNHNEPQPERIGVESPNYGGSVPIVVRTPFVAADNDDPRFQLLAPQSLADGLLPINEMLADLDDLLGPRGLVLLRESRRALTRGLYLASSSLLAAASEAAWFRLAGSVGSSRSLLDLVASGRDVAKIIELTTQRLRELRVNGTTVTEVAAQAQHFRDVRNYALHPVTEHDADREAWLDEAGATLLAVAARRYFVKMAVILEEQSTSTNQEG
ncbi:hypothetical protein EFK50_14110 [Nocardioides marmoriginsengisoli]|uniref:Uncharacterized protein n=1 Tax=Nocardioides marmoriginsengisoli TaxID=661483 RepID=A0A3N0CIU6_9ACTN|nr:hypothetical protein [Nocardioides marmoriginsengisoli]RNL62863.1 hypothetical protein EFK50_14110 [Nocardioides marmoriginsengisoli]